MGLRLNFSDEEVKKYRKTIDIERSWQRSIEDFRKACMSRKAFQIKTDRKMGGFVGILFSSVALIELLSIHSVGGTTRSYEFNIQLKNVTRLCHTKSMVTVNGKFPGPRIVAREGDRLLIKVTNHVPNNITIHWYVG
ncbi:hypothetical protein Ccrd_025790 [Cynara cardunculus var. scolymus]|uniref:Plastocyanin-like domain-containing protein n=1 Tax=Cynara cardunculus var. scolymus TaxID=59895 RepID=A0A103USH7_CYNCS|nr:hypothetical protein Ccrd_025790 [Cynara cardunculus var. scolymus]